MKKLMLALWLCLPVAAAAYHYGPGQERLQLDAAGALIKSAGQHAAQEDWGLAEKAYGEALELLPKGEARRARRIRLERAKAQMHLSQLPTAYGELGRLVDELTADPKADQALVDDARSSLANAQYYMTWLMRLEGQPREAWEPIVEGARQNYRLLAEKSDKLADAAASIKHREDLEASIKLARLDLNELQGLPLPSQ